MTPPKHVDFEAKKLFGAVGEMIDSFRASVPPRGPAPRTGEANAPLEVHP